MCVIFTILIHRSLLRDNYKTSLVPNSIVFGLFKNIFLWEFTRVDFRSFRLRAERKIFNSKAAVSEIDVRLRREWSGNVISKAVLANDE